MVKTLRIWLFTFSKRLLRKPFFIALLCIFPLLSIGITIYSQQENPLLQVALFAETEDELALKTIQSLKTNHKVVHFYEVTSGEELKNDVKKSKAECGYIFTKHYTLEHLIDVEQLNNSIQVIESPNSMLTGSMNELVFSSFFEFYTKELILDYLQNGNIVSKTEKLSAVTQKASQYFDKYSTAEGIFSFETTNHSSKHTSIVTSSITDTFLTNLCRGILSILILLAAMCGGLLLIQDNKSNLLLPLPYSVRPVIELLELLAPAMLMAVSGLIGLAILPNSHSLWKEALGLCFYVPLTVLFTHLLLRIIRTESLYHTAFPIVIISTLLLSPALFDLSVYIKLLTLPKYLFVNTYYLEALSGNSFELPILVAFTLILGIAEYTTFYLIKKRPLSFDSRHGSLL